MVGAKGFEPSTSWSRTRRASQAALRPEYYSCSLTVYAGLLPSATAEAEAEKKTAGEPSLPRQSSRRTLISLRTRSATQIASRADS
jgi:hypothetical protein